MPRKPSGLVSTTVGRVLFNDILHPKMAFYDVAMTSKQLARVISDCYLLLGRRETIELLDRMKELGFKESTRSGLSFAADDLRTPANFLVLTNLYGGGGFPRQAQLGMRFEF